MAHTPGPWRVSHDEHEPYWNIDMPRRDGSSGYGYCNAMVYTTEVDARLIAAAPELLAALKGLIPWNIDGDPPPQGWGAWADAAAAIAKAEGRSGNNAVS